MTTPTTPSDDLEAAAKVAAEGPGPLTLLADREWQDLCEKDDRTSPADYPEMCLIARNELGGIISEGFLLAKDQDAAAHRALEAKVVELVAERLADKARIAELEGERDELSEILHDLVMVDGEERATGGGPGFKVRHDKAWTLARERFEP